MSNFLKVYSADNRRKHKEASAGSNSKEEQEEEGSESVVRPSLYVGWHPVESRAGYPFARSLHLKKIRSAEPLPEELGYDSRLMLEQRMNAFYLCIPMPLQVRSKNQAPTIKRVIALDPGVRTFMTSYDLSGESIDFAKQDIGHIYRCEAMVYIA